MATVEGDEEPLVDVLVVNARTGDVAGPSEISFIDGYTVRKLATQEVKIFYRCRVPGVESEAWDKDAKSFQDYRSPRAPRPAESTST